MRFLALALFSLSFTVHAFAQLIDTAWVRTFAAGTGNHAQLTAMELDSLGNPVVIGWTSTPSTNADFLILKYLADGDTAWLRTFDFAEHGDDRATAISILSGFGIVGVSGTCHANEYSATVVLSSEGAVLDTLLHPMHGLFWSKLWHWFNIFGEPEVVVAGESAVAPGWLELQQRSPLLPWSAEPEMYKGIGAIATITGGILVCGERVYGLGTAFVTARIDASSGVTTWLEAEEFNGIGPGFPPSAMQEIGSGGVVVTGLYRSMTWTHSPYEVRWLTFCYNQSGQKLWQAQYVACGFNWHNKPAAILVDNSGSTIIAGHAKPPHACTNFVADTTSIVILKYDSDGNLDWDIRYSAPDIVRHDVVGGAVDPAGNIYVVANVFADPAVEDYDVLVAKFNTAGGLVWTYTYASGAVGDDLAKTIRLDDANNIYVCGTSADEELFVIKLAQSAAVAITDDLETFPTEFELSQNFPNPFNPATEIEFSLLRSGMIELDVFNVNGQLVRSLVHQELAAGRHRIAWDATDNFGRAVASGVYFYRISTAGSAESRKMLLLR